MKSWLSLATGTLLAFLTSMGIASVLDGATSASNINDNKFTIAQGSSGTGGGNNYNDAVVLWRGFHHSWTYNHRLNRLGDFISDMSCANSPCTAQVIHTAASGTGEDTASFTSYFTHLAANHVGMQPGFVRISLSGNEGEMLIGGGTYSVSAQSNTRAAKKYQVVLNGFDILASGQLATTPEGTNPSADKLQYFYIDIANERYDAESDQIKFDLLVYFKAYCSSIECPLFRDIVNYNVRVSYVIFAGGDRLYFKEKEFGKRYEWDKSSEVYLDSERHRIVGNSSGEYTEAALAFKRIFLKLDDEHHLLEWDAAIKSVEYTASSGIYYFDLDLFFKQWRAGMPIYSYKESGWAEMKATVVLLQFKDAYVRHQSHSGSIHWEGGGESANTDSAMSSHEVSFSY